ncbi:hypothetical protein XFF6992_50245 [Xanthomonas citri pv. fuscans]|nr:hypothetical protein XFF6992_50245 [Xanthomonas citri pv. fuscans]SOO34466.1 hypothetical protein XFF6994_410006 [Xanthomonas citri pv. fuscans]
MFGRVPRRKQGLGGSGIRYVGAPNARMANPRGAGASLASFRVCSDAYRDVRAQTAN